MAKSITDSFLSAIREILNIKYKTSFGQNGGIVVGAGTYTGNFVCFIPDADGAFGAGCISNITGLSSTNFYKGIGKYFNASTIVISSGSGTLYNR